MSRFHARSMLTGMAAGAGLMYLFDPRLGRRRRALIRDQLVHSVHLISDTADATYKDLANRTYGKYARMRSRWRTHDQSDSVVVQRVRSKIGRYVSNPRAIHVAACEGQVTLSGPILAQEVAGLLSAAQSVIGVCRVENCLDIHVAPGNISALQVASRRKIEPQQG